VTPRSDAMALTGFEGQDIRTLLDRLMAARAEHPCLIWEPFDGDAAQWTYAAFVGRIQRVAAGLQARGVRPGDRILVHLDNCPEFLFAWLGCAYAGVVAVTTNTQSVADDILYFVEHSGAIGAITQARYEREVARALGEGWMVLVDRDKGIAELESEPLSQGDLRPPDPAAPFGIQYTSGTTARPKAVLWSHANAMWGGRVSAMHEGLTREDVHLVFLPLFHTNAQVYSVLASLWVGATIVLQPKFSASRFWDVAICHRCTWTSVVPFCTAALMDFPVPRTHPLRFFGAAGLLPEVEARLGVRMVTWWGMTETVSHGIIGSPDNPPAAYAMGFASPAYEILVLDGDLRPVGLGSVGDLYVRGRRGLSLFVEYAGDPAATAAAFTPDGLFITGDRVMLGQDGSLTFVERTKDMLKVGGENVAAVEVERILLQVEGVLEAAVVGKSHPMLGEVPVAFVIIRGLHSDDVEHDIAKACEAGLAAFKRPVEIRVVADFPRATLNKIAKSKLRELLAGEIQ
jgi:crotonobetaine/carnitine-CoA ligase